MSVGSLKGVKMMMAVNEGRPEASIFAARIRGPVTDLPKVVLAVGETNEMRDSAFQSKSPDYIAHRERRVFRPVSR
jgi:hypothetical protein